jgi:hypothetical protein
MIASLLFSLCLVSGISLARWLPLRFSRMEVIVWGMVLGLFLGAWILFLTSLLFSYALSIPLGCLLLVSSIVASWKLKTIEEPRDGLPSGITYRAWWGITVVSAVLLSYLFYTHMMQVRPDGWYTKGGSWGDLALHLNLITYFADQAHFSFQFPLLYKGALTYPFLIDFYSGLLYRLGWSVQACLLIPGLTLALCLVQLFLALSLRLFKSTQAAVISLVLFFLNGSVAGSYFAFQDWRQSGISLWMFLSHLPQEYSQSPSHNLQFTNIIIGALLPQRSILFGFAIFCMALTVWVFSWPEKGKKAYLVLFSGLLLGLLPFAHPHTFLVAMLMFGWLNVLRFYKKSPDKWHWMIAFLIALAVAAPQGAWQAMATFHTGFSYSHFGWVMEPGDNIIVFWLRTWGLELPLFLLIPVMTWNRIERWKTYLFIPFLILFFVVNVYVFQPYSYDNIKLIFYIHFGFALFAGWFLARFCKKGWLASASVVIVIISLVATGLLSLTQQSTDLWAFLSTQDIDFAQQARSVIPPDALVLNADQHNHPISTMSGRHIVMGYRGWLWSYGIQYATIERDVLAMFAGGNEGVRLLRQYGVNYIVIGPPELTTWGANQAFYQANYTLVLHSGPWFVYRVL